MSRRRDNYENSRAYRFRRWLNGEIDPLENGIETVVPEKQKDAEKTQASGAWQEEAAKEKNPRAVLDTKGLKISGSFIW